MSFVLCNPVVTVILLCTMQVFASQSARGVAFAASKSATRKNLHSRTMTWASSTDVASLSSASDPIVPRATSPIITVKNMQSRALSSTSSDADSDKKKTQDDETASSLSDTVVLDPLIVCGPSGVGKGTIIQRYMEQKEGSRLFGFTVSHTTRAPRQGEVHGQHYHFCSPLEMQQLLAEKAFLESAHVHGNYYGTSWMAMETVQQKGKKCLLDIDVQGVQRIKALQDEQEQSSSSSTMSSRFRLQPRYIFIAPPSLATLEERLIGRASESAESLQTRLANAKAEVQYGTLDHFDAIIVNDQLDTAVQEFARAVNDLYDDV